ncbi:MAG: TetR/AcrR family transcriptional regulator [Bacteroidota bacterium]
MQKNKSRRAEILEKSARLIRKKGYAATTVKDIADELQIQPASLYNHIKNKQEILQAVLLPLAARYTKGIQEITNSPLTSIQQLERVIADQIRITIENTDAVSLIPNEWVHLDDDIKRAYLKLRDDYEKEFKKILRKCIKDGYLRSVNVEIASFSILSTLRWLYSWYAKNKNVNALVLETELITNLVGGLKKA